MSEKDTIKRLNNITSKYFKEGVRFISFGKGAYCAQVIIAGNPIILKQNVIDEQSDEQLNIWVKALLISRIRSIMDIAKEDLQKLQ